MENLNNTAVQSFEQANGVKILKIFWLGVTQPYSEFHSILNDHMGSHDIQRCFPAVFYSRYFSMYKKESMLQQALIDFNYRGFLAVVIVPKRINFVFKKNEIISSEVAGSKDHTGYVYSESIASLINEVCSYGAICLEMDIKAHKEKENKIVSEGTDYSHPEPKKKLSAQKHKKAVDSILKRLTKIKFRSHDKPIDNPDDINARITRAFKKTESFGRYKKVSSFLRSAYLFSDYVFFDAGVVITSLPFLSPAIIRHHLMTLKNLDVVKTIIVITTEKEKGSYQKLLPDNIKVIVKTLRTVNF